MYPRREASVALRHVYLLVLVILSLSALPLRAQQVPLWNIVDTSRTAADDTLQYAMMAAACDRLHLVDLEQIHNVGSRLILRATHDGGETWKTVYRPGSGLTVRAVAHPTPGVIIVVGDSTYRDSGDGNLHYVGVILRSSDGGASWRQIVTAKDTRAIDIQMLDDHRGVLYLSNWVYGKGPLGDTMLITDDGGETWISQPSTARNPLYPSLYRVSQGGFLSISGISSYSNSTLQSTSDGGLTWSTVKDGPPGIAAIDVIDSTDIWCVANPRTGRDNLKRDQIWHSTDGGDTWRLLYDAYDESSANLTSIAAADSRHIMAAGGAKAVRTIDGGATWEQMPLPYRADVPQLNGGIFLNAIVYPADTVAFAFGNGIKLAWRGATVLAPPTVLAPMQGDDQVMAPFMLRWSAAGGATSYDIQIGDTTLEAEDTDRTIYRKLAVDESQLRDTSYQAPLAPGRHYMVRVRARNDRQVSDWSTDVAFSTLPEEGVDLYPVINAPPSGAMNLPTTVEIRWDPIPGADAYDLQLANSERFGSGVFDTILVDKSGIMGTSVTLSELSQNRWYFVRVRGTSDIGYKGPWSTPIHDFKTSGPASVIDGPKTLRSYDLALAPNPAHGSAPVELSLNVRHRTAATVAVVDMLGRELRRGARLALEPGEHRIPVDVEELPTGMYLVTVLTADGERSLPLVIAGR